ncbi:MAG TPA: alpha/beta fold hydrolase [Chloroflexia bacterium]|nr:alpha/beta fold hydrolase [Chloroflexia bacterium]
MPESRSGFAPVNGTELYYEVTGEGPALVLVHAGVSDHRLWDDQVPVFAEHYQVIRYDMRGFGRSAMPPGTFSLREDLYGLLQALGVDRAAVCGVSMGGRTVVEFALEHPEMTTAVVPVAAGFVMAEPTESTKALFAQLEPAYEARDIDRVVDLELAIWLAGPARDPQSIPAALREKFRLMERHNLEIEFAGEEGQAEWLDGVEDRLTEIKAPTLVIVGDQDLTGCLATADLLAAQVPGARKVVLPNVAHLPPLEVPGDFNRLVLDFLADR